MRRASSAPHSSGRPSGLGRLARALPRPGSGHGAPRTCDQLTGLLDRDSLAVEFPVIVRRACHEHTHVAILSLDIDHFRRVNEEFGRARGDSVLVTFGRRVCEVLRETENAFRWGGEQFVIAAYGHDALEAHALAERLRDAVASRPVGGVQLSVSIGVAVGHDLCDEADALVDAAGVALRQAKRMGRGQIGVADWDSVDAAPAPIVLAPLAQVAAYLTPHPAR